MIYSFNYVAEVDVKGSTAVKCVYKSV